MLDSTEVQEIATAIREGARVDGFEHGKCDIKKWPEKSGGLPDMKRLAEILREYAVAFANADGGSLILGIRENRDGSGVIEGCSDYNLEELRKIVFTGTRPPLTVDFVTVEVNEGPLVIMETPKSPAIHATTAGIRYKRVGRDNQIIYPEQDARVAVSKGEDFTSLALQEAKLDVVDAVEVDRLRNWLDRYSPESGLREVDNAALLRNLNLLVSDRGVDCLTVGGLLLVGRKKILNSLLPQHEVIYLRFDEGDDTTPVQQSYMKEPLLKTIDKLWDFIEPHNSVTIIKDSLFETPVPSYPEDVVREGLLNALMHRDYTVSDPVLVKLYSDRLEISNPGGFIAGITPDNILTHAPARRNPHLAEAFQHIGVVNRAGLGVDRMYRRLLSYGKLPPDYPPQEEAVGIILRNHTFDEAMAKFVGRKAKEGHGWRLTELIILHYLRQHDRITTVDAAEVCQISQRDASTILSSMEGVFVERFGTGKGTYYQLSARILEELGEGEKYSRIQGLTEERKLDLLRNHVQRTGSITNEQTQQIAQVNRHQAFRLLRKLVEEGLIEQRGGGRGARYDLARTSGVKA